MNCGIIFPMQFSNITNLLVSPVTSAIHYFKESSWKGRAVQIVVAASLIYFVARLWKASARSRTSLIKRASTFAPQKAKLEGGKLVSAEFADKEFVKALFTRIESSHLGGEIDEVVVEWKETDQPQVWEPRYKGIEIWLSNHLSSNEKIVKDPRLLHVLSDWKEIPEKLLNPQAEIDKREFCLEFKKWIEELKKFDQIRKNALKAALTTELNKIQERQFEKLEEYIQYLIPDETTALRLLGMKRREIGGRGLVSMQDIDVLRIREFEPHVITLRQLFCCMRFELDGGETSPELLGCFLDEIETFRQKISNAKSSPWIQEGTKAVLTQVDAILASCNSDTLTLESSAKFVQNIEELEQWDKLKQKGCLRSYMLQANHASAWQNIFTQRIFSLSEYYAIKNIENVNALYHLNNHGPHGRREVSDR